MTRALNGMAGCCFREPNPRQLFANVVEFDLPSRRVLHKCGFQRKDVFRRTSTPTGSSTISVSMPVSVMTRPATEQPK